MDARGGRKTPRKLIWSVLIAVGALVASTLAHAGECEGRFPEGWFGIAPSHPALTNVTMPGFSPLYLVKQAVTISRPEDCQYVYTSDVFRMVSNPVAGGLVAGCVGDFDGDGIDDVALLMRRQRDGAVIPFVFRSGAAKHQGAEIEPVIDPYGFAEDKSTWPGPLCIPKPPNGVFKSWVDEETVIKVVGDLFTIGWKTYFWNPSAGRFDGIFTQD